MRLALFSYHVQWFHSRRCSAEVAQLGDIIDGCNSKLKASETALKSVLDVLSRRERTRCFEDGERKASKLSESSHCFHNMFP